VLFLIITLYMIGKNRNLLGATFSIKAVLNNVNGLVAGNNVRFKGIDVGTVKEISIINDSTIHVTMTIDEKVKFFIKQNAMASIGTDGLMGNKLLNINSAAGPSDPVVDGSFIQAVKPIETDEMLRTLSTTNDNLERITHNLREVTLKLNTSSSLWNLLSDTVITGDLRMGVRDFRAAGSNLADLTQTTDQMISRFDQGDGLASTVFTDSSLTTRLNVALDKIVDASERTSGMMRNMETIINGLQEGEGTAGLLLADTALRNTLVRSGQNVEQATERLNQNMEAMRSHFLLRGYYKKLEKEQEKKK
jgi:phospholipid/cholesterol/gamma-HCH transport system substrate-binding protein